MSVPVSGTAGDLRITFCARIDHQDGQHIVELDSLEHAAHERLMQLLLADPTLADLLHNFPTTDATAPHQHSETSDCPIGDDASGLHPTSESAPSQRTGHNTAQQGEPPSDRGGVSHNGVPPQQGRPAPSTGDTTSDGSQKSGNPSGSQNQKREESTEEWADSQSPYDSPPANEPDPENQQHSENSKSPIQSQQKGFGGTSKGKRSKRAKKQKLWFTPTPRARLPEYSCSRFGRRYVKAAQPEGLNSLSPGPCDYCEGCTEARRHEKMEQYEASAPSPISTVLECQFPTFLEANDFGQLDEHKQRLSQARRCTLFTPFLRYELDKPWVMRLIWDGPASDEEKDAIEHHANTLGASDVSVTVGPVSPQQFKEWVPYKFSMKKDTGGFYILCRFSNGWAQKQKEPSDHRSGLKSMELTDKSAYVTPEAVQIERTQENTKSWRGTYRLSQNNLVPPEQRHELAQEAQRELERARYVSLMDWIQRWETLQPEPIELSRKFIDDYLCGENPSAREWQEATNGPKALVVETARWLKGERDHEPSILMVAERLAYINTWGEPAIDPHYLAKHTSNLPPLEFHDAPYDMDGSFDEFDPFDDYEAQVA